MSRNVGSTSGERERLLRRSLTANAIFSGTSGALLVAATGPVAAFLGWTDPAAPVVLVGIGAGLLAFAAAIGFPVRASRPNQRVVRTIVGLDVAWVLGSALLLALGFAPSGRGAAAIGGVAAVVGLLAAGQAMGLARVQRADRGNAM